MNRDLLVAPTQPTMYFIGVTTGQSSIMSVFPRWASHLGIDATIAGIDLPLHAPADDYRRVVEFIAHSENAVGALVTTHKLDLFAACRDQFDYVDPLARLMSEVSCISKRGQQVRCHAKDPISGGLAVDAIIPAGGWHESRAEALFVGAGGSTVAITWHLIQDRRGPDRPSRIRVTNRSKPRLEHISQVHESLGSAVPIEYHHCPEPSDNDKLVAKLARGSLVVNATGLGKDAPGSPITSAVSFPRGAVAWDLNYRGDLEFLDISRNADPALGVRVEDGWVYFLHGWLQAIGEVFDFEVPVAGSEFEALSDLAGGAPGR